jgi:3-hydroxyacyl-[acyl-carrier-protein] dehydratase
MNKIAQRRNMWWFHGEAKVDGQIACEADIGAMIAEE